MNSPVHVGVNFMSKKIRLKKPGGDFKKLVQNDQTLKDHFFVSKTFKMVMFTH